MEDNKKSGDFEFKRRYSCSREGTSWGIHCALGGCGHCFDRALELEEWGEPKLLAAARVWNYYGRWPGLNGEDYLTKDEVEALPRPSYQEHYLSSNPRVYSRDERVKAWKEFIANTASSPKGDRYESSNERNK